MGLDFSGSLRYPHPRADWLALTEEETLDPELPIIDAHHHIWTEADNPYLLDDLIGDLGSGHNIVATVFVEARYRHRTDGPDHLRPVGETEAIMRLVEASKARAIKTQVCAGIVAHADLTLGDRVNAVLDAHREAGGDRVKGIRHSVSRDSHFPDGIVLRPAPAHLLAEPNYSAGLNALAQRGLSFDAMLYHQQIPELMAVAQALPDLRIVLDHLGTIIGVGPYQGRERENFEAWRRDIAALARCPNVSVKIGGFGMVITGATWHERARPPSSMELAEAWKPYIETCIDLFGADRCMFESNFPVDKAMFSYNAVWNAFKRLSNNASQAEKRALFHDNARDFYRL